ncbi:MAG TPA: prolipoprotein diacylglyceryl transferase [Corynebacteriales bacterium]|nr:prolipoprotein diacylglyceryl transferase [Mycobacteriales bacterium]
MSWAYLPSPSRGYFSLGSLQIHFYALCIILGAAVGIAIAARRWKQRGGNKEDLYDALLLGIPIGIIGARLYHVITDYQLYFGPDAPNNPVDALKIWEGGLGIWGGIFAGALAVYLFAKKRRLPVWDMADAMAPGILVAQGIGRLGNWFNQELYGHATDVPWGLEIYERVGGVSTGNVIAVVHPTFLYEMLWCLLGAAFLILVDKKLVIGYGRLFASYGAVYCLGRFWIELLRSDAARTILGLRINTWVSGVCLIVALGFVIFGKRGRRTPTEVQQYGKEPIGKSVG